MGACGPFSDISDPTFCEFVLEIFTLGITTGTTPTTYSPSDNVNRLQMAAFLSRTVDGVLQRDSRRAALKQFWTTQNDVVASTTTVGFHPVLIESDGADVWVANRDSFTISRVRGSDGRVLETWTGAFRAVGVLIAAGRVFASQNFTPGALFMIDPRQPAGAVTAVATNLGDYASGMAYDGFHIWTANNANSGTTGGSVSFVTPSPSLPWTVVTVTTGYQSPQGALFDGTNVWVTDGTSNTLLKLNGNGSIAKTVTVGTDPQFPVFDGANIWVPNVVGGSVSVVRASSGLVIGTLTGNGLSSPTAAAFDGQRVLVTNQGNGTVSLWKAADLKELGSFSVGSGGSIPIGACSDGVSFWVSLFSAGQIARF
jgi:hypothetical protein